VGPFFTTFIEDLIEPPPRGLEQLSEKAAVEIMARTPETYRGDVI
jgi:hypothetical protein